MKTISETTAEHIREVETLLAVAHDFLARIMVVDTLDQRRQLGRTMDELKGLRGDLRKAQNDSVSETEYALEDRRTADRAM